MASRASQTSRLAREIAIVLALKLAALFVIWSIWFAHPQAPRLDTERIADTLYSPHPVAEERRAPNAQP